MQPLRSIRARVRSLGPARVDALIAAVFLAEGLLEAELFYRGARHAWIGIGATVLVAAGLAVRRRSPLVALALGLAGFMAFQPLGRDVNDNTYAPFFAVLFLLFSFGMFEPSGRRLLAGFVLVFAGNAIGITIDSYPTTVVDVFFGGLVIAGGPILLGRVISNRSRLNATLREKAEQLRHERTDQAEQAAADERARIAGELHDVVAHAMSAMVVQAGGARRLAHKDPERAREAFAAVEDTGREALTEIRRLLGVLRREDDEIALAPQPSLRHLAALLRRVEAAGLPVDLQVDGEERPLPPGVDLTAYRLVQAALGGALEQGAAGRAEVLVRYRPDGVDLEVLDDGTGGDGTRPLPGVRERVSLYGGQLHAGRAEVLVRYRPDGVDLEVLDDGTGGDGTRLLPGVRERVSLYGGQLHAGRRRSGGHAVRAKLPVGSGS